MTATAPQDIITVSYTRQPAEEAKVMTDAAIRFGTPLLPPGGLTTRYLLIGLVGGAGISLFLHAYRNLVLLPFLGLTPLIEVSDLLAICALPCLLIYMLLTLQLRREARQRLATTAGRIEPDVIVTVSISKHEIVWEWAGNALRLPWRQISDIALRYGRIEFESDAAVAYIPAHAFHNQQEQTAVMARIQAFWRPAVAAKP